MLNHLPDLVAFEFAAGILLTVGHDHKNNKSGAIGIIHRSQSRSRFIDGPTNGIQQCCRSTRHQRKRRNLFNSCAGMNELVLRIEVNQRQHRFARLHLLLFDERSNPALRVGPYGLH